MKTIGAEHERGSMAYLLLVHDVLLEAIESGANVAHYRHGAREVRIEGRPEIGRLLFALNRRIASLMAEQIRRRGRIRDAQQVLRSTAGVAAGRLDPETSGQILRGTL